MKDDLTGVITSFLGISREELVFNAALVIAFFMGISALYFAIYSILIWLGLDLNWKEEDLPECHCQVLTPEPSYIGVPKQEPGCLYLDHDILMWYFISKDLH